MTTVGGGMSKANAKLDGTRRKPTPPTFSAQNRANGATRVAYRGVMQVTGMYAAPSEPTFMSLLTRRAPGGTGGEGHAVARPPGNL